MSIFPALERAVSHSFFLQLFFLPRRLLHEFLCRHRAFFRSLGDGSYFLFFLRSPGKIRFKDYGLILLSFEMSFSISMFMQSSLTPLRRNFSFFFFLLSLLAIGPIDRLQIRSGKKIVDFPARFSYVVGALIFGFLGSLISLGAFTKMMLFFIGILFALRPGTWGASAALVLFPFLGTPATAVLLLVTLGARALRRAVRVEALPRISPVFLLFFLVAALFFLAALLWSPALLSYLPLLLAYPAAGVGKEYKTLLLSALLLSALTFLYPTALLGSIILIFFTLLGLLGEKGRTLL